LVGGEFQAEVLPVAPGGSLFVYNPHPTNVLTRTSLSPHMTNFLTPHLHLICSACMKYQCTALCGGLR
jgi:hypothetical protein